MFNPETDYFPAVRLALNANVEPAVEVKAIWYDEWDEVFIVHYVDPADNQMYEDTLQGNFVFSCFKAVQRGITRWTSLTG